MIEIFFMRLRWYRRCWATGYGVVSTSHARLWRLESSHLQVALIVRIQRLTSILDPPLDSSVPARHWRETVLVDLLARLLEGSKLWSHRVGTICHGCWCRSGLVPSVRSWRHTRIVVLKLGPVAPSAGGATRTATNTTCAEFSTAAKTPGKAPDKGEENERANDNSYYGRPSSRHVSKDSPEGLSRHILAVGLLHTLIPTAERLGRRFNIVDDVARE